MLHPTDESAHGRDWAALNRTSLVDVIDQLSREHIATLMQEAESRGNAASVARLTELDGNLPWDVFGPGIGMISNRQEKHITASSGSNSAERYAVLSEAVAPLFFELQSGRFSVEAEGDETISYEVRTLPIGFWRETHWVLYRASPVEPASSLLVSFSPEGEQQEPIYYNPKLIVTDRISSRTALPTTQTKSERKGTRPGPHSQVAEMIRGLELARNDRKLQPGMTQKQIYGVMLDALGFKESPPKGFGLDAFRKNCREWLIRHGLVHIGGQSDR